VLGAAALVAAPGEALAAALRRYAAAAALLSLLFATALRGAQIHTYVEDHLSRRPPFEFAARELVFIKLDYEVYTQDFVQNDPFLREPGDFLLSRGRVTDKILLRKYFPAARHVRDAPYGHVWRLD
jgi:hypothetical protein